MSMSRSGDGTVASKNIHAVGHTCGGGDGNGSTDGIGVGGRVGCGVVAAVGAFVAVVFGTVGIGVTRGTTLPRPAVNGTGVAESMMVAVGSVGNDGPAVAVLAIAGVTEGAPDCVMGSALVGAAAGVPDKSVVCGAAVGVAGIEGVGMGCGMADVGGYVRHRMIGSLQVETKRDAVVRQHTTGLWAPIGSCGTLNCEAMNSDKLETGNTARGVTDTNVGISTAHATNAGVERVEAPATTVFTMAIAVASMLTAAVTEMAEGVLSAMQIIESRSVASEEMEMLPPRTRFVLWYRMKPMLPHAIETAA